MVTSWTMNEESGLELNRLMQASHEFPYSTLLKWFRCRIPQNHPNFSFSLNQSSWETDEPIHIKSCLCRTQLMCEPQIHIQIFKSNSFFRYCDYKKLFCKELAGEQTYSYPSNILCNHFSIRVIHIKNFNCLDLNALKVLQ